MKILHIFKTYFPDSMGGIEQFIYQLASRHIAAGHEVTVLSLSKSVKKPEKQTINGITTWRFPLDIEIASNGFSFSLFWHIRRIALDHDLIHYQFPWPTGDLLHQFIPRHIPALVSYQSDIVKQKWLKWFYKPLMYRFLNQMQSIIAASPNYIASSPVLQHYKDKVKMIPIGLDESLYPTPSPDLIAKWRNLLGEEFFLFLGVLRYYKGLHIAIEAALKNGKTLVIAGSGGLEKALKAQANGAENIHFTGQVSDEDKMALLSLCRAFVFPSHQRSEAFGISLLEAAMSGKPMISCEIGTGTSFVNQADITGLVVPPEDSEAFSAAMLKLCDKERATQMGKAARLHYESLFTADQMAEDYLGIYATLVQHCK